MRKVVAFCTLLAVLCCFTAYASNTPSQPQSAKANFGKTQAAKPAAQKGVNTPYDLQVKKGQVDAANVQQPSTAADKSVEHATTLKAEYQAIMAQIAEVQSQGGDFSALKRQAADLYLQIYGSQPSNRNLDQGGDNCATATVISQLPYCDTGTTVGYADDYNPGTCIFSQGAPDVVYVLTAPQDAVVTISLCGSGYDTGLGVYDGCPDAGANVACNDDYCGLQSCVTVTLVIGHTYYIVVDGFGSNSGNYSLNVNTEGVCGPCPQPGPANDDCANATTLTLPATVTGSTTSATADAAPECGTSVDAPGVWYLVMGDGATITASTCGNSVTNYDSKLHVYVCGCDHLTCVTGNDDCGQSPNGLASIVSWCSRAGEPYWIFVEGFAGNIGNFQLDVSSDGVACDGGARCPCWDNTLEAPGSLSGSTITEDADCNEGYPDYTVQVTIPSAGQWNFTLCGSDYDTYLGIGTDCCDLSVCFNDDNECDGQFTLQSSCCVEIPAGIYYVWISGWSGLSGNFVLTVSPCGQPPQGETCADAIVIGSLPYSANGTTLGHNDDIDAPCEWGGSTAPDVVYSYTPSANEGINISLCNSWYDTKVAVYDAATGELLCCNDDACDNPDYQGDDGYQSYIACCQLLAGHTYCIVVDGYGSAAGEYNLYVEHGDCGGCVVECPQGSTPEGEGCEGDINGGCNTEGLPTTPIHCGEVMCGSSRAVGGTRDTDFYELVLTQPTTVNWCVYAEFAPQVAIVSTGTFGCSDVTVYANVIGEGECQVTCASAECLPAGTYWLFAATSVFDGVPCGDYIAHVECTPCGGCNPTQVVQMTTTPIPQYQCAQLCPGSVTGLVICGDGADPSRPPIVTITPGCSPLNTRCDVDCDPASAFEYDPAGWVWDSGCWYNHVVGVTPGCVCVCLEGFLGVEFNHDFIANGTDGAVELSWSTASESNNARFDILRDGATVAQVPASNITTGHAYAWTDRQVQNGTSYSYTLVAVDVNSNRQELATVNALPTYGAAVITEYALHQNYPNPFNPETNITFDLVEAGNVSLAVYNLMGQQVANVMNGQLAAGRHTMNFNAANLPSGVYLYKLNVNGFAAEKKMVLMK